jgi:antirestriction protein
MVSIISRLDEDEKKAIGFLMSNHIVKDFDGALDKLDEVVIHEDSSMEDIAYDLIQDCYALNDIPEIIANNIDYERIARDLSTEGCYFEEGNTIFEYRG